MRKSERIIRKGQLLAKINVNLPTIESLIAKAKQIREVLDTSEKSGFMYDASIHINIKKSFTKFLKSKQQK